MDFKNIVKFLKSHISFYEMETRFHLHKIQIERKLIYRSGCRVGSRKGHVGIFWNDYNYIFFSVVLTKFYAIVRTYWTRHLQSISCYLYHINHKSIGLSVTDGEVRLRANLCMTSLWHLHGLALCLSQPPARFRQLLIHLTVLELFIHSVDIS